MPSQMKPEPCLKVLEFPLSEVRHDTTHTLHYLPNLAAPSIVRGTIGEMDNQLGISRRAIRREDSRAGHELVWMLEKDPLVVPVHINQRSMYYKNLWSVTLFLVFL